MALTRRALAGVLAAVLLGVMTLSVVGAGASWAGPKEDDKGQNDKARDGRSGDSGWTEDNDTNDGGTPNNVPDEGDNRHPSGRDKSVENGGSGTQGKSASDPDGDSNGGPDKPNGSGGVDKADQDGNNGCGNDDDFEDDNNGNCGGRKKQRSGWNSASATSSGAAQTRASQESRTTESQETEVMVSGGASWLTIRAAGLGSAVRAATSTGTRTAGARLAGSTAAGGGRVFAAGTPALAFADDGTRVMGTAFERDEPAFAFTGGDFARLALAGLVLVGLGAVISQARRASSAA